jgi:hypothetical protein
MPLSKIADAAMDDVTETQKKASIELQRRLIHALFTVLNSLLVAG